MQTTRRIAAVAAAALMLTPLGYGSVSAERSDTTVKSDTINTHKVRWTTAKPIKKGRYLRLTWWSGVAPCTVLDRVKVKETAKKVVVTVYEGTKPSARDTMCVAMAVKKTKTVKLKSRLGTRKVVDGAR